MNNPGRKTVVKVALWILIALGVYWLITSGLDMIRGDNAWKKDLSPEAIQELNDGAYTVSRVIDGNIIELDSGEKVQLIGVDTPAPKDNRGKEAAEFTRNLVEGHQVRLEHDVQRKDKHGRLLAYVWYLAEIQKPSKIIDPKTGKPFMDDDYEDAMLNEALIKAGYAKVVAVPPNVKYQELFVKAEKEARDKKRGLWK